MVWGWKMLAAAAVLLLAPMAAQAEDNVGIGAFEGRWGGSAIANNRDSLYFGITVRDMDVVIDKTDQGFVIEWTTVIRGGGDPDNPDERLKSTTKRYVEEAPGVFRASDAEDPLGGGAYSWARIEGRSLIVYMMGVRDGKYAISKYVRTLTGEGMDLEFSLVRDGENVRKVAGKLVRHE